MPGITTFFITIALIGAAAAVLRIVFGVSIHFETKKAARTRKELERKHAQAIRKKEEEALEQIIEDSTNKVRRNLQKTIDKMDTYISDEFSRALAEEVIAHKKAANDIRTAALQTIEHSMRAIEEQRQTVDKEVARQVAEVKAALIVEVEKNLADILRFYVENAMRDQLSVDDQVRGIISGLERDKKRILQDMKDDL